MGGNALKELGFKRIGLEEFNSVKSCVLEKLPAFCEKAEVPKYIEDKSDFGDLDVLGVLKPNINPREKIIEIFNPTLIKQNGNIYSFDVKNLQIDLILTTGKNWGCYYSFLSFGDLGMCLGRISRLYSLKYGIDGLSLPVRNVVDNHIIATIDISKDIRKILRFFGYNVSVWENGFKTEKELCDFIFSSPKIHQGFLNKDSENCTHRKRDRKRSAYKRIYEWFQENKDRFPTPQPEKPFLEQLNEVDAYFPESCVKEKYELVIEEIKKTELAREKFSGDYISRLLGIKGKELGLVIEAWSKKFKSKQEKIDYILKTDILILEKEVKDL